MKYNFFFIALFSAFLNCFSQNQTMKNNLETIYFNEISRFEEDTSSYTLENINIVINNTNVLTLKKVNKVISNISLDTNYEGPGFQIYSYKNKQHSNTEVIVIEATADIGVAWYYIILLDNGSIIKQFYVKEPRHNSDSIDIKDFLEIYCSNRQLTLKFRKKHIATYSIIPKSLKRDKNFIYLYK